jgi:hypothetical protein
MTYHIHIPNSLTAEESYLKKMPQFILETVKYTATGYKEQNMTEEIKIHTYKYKK